MHHRSLSFCSLLVVFAIGSQAEAEASETDRSLAQSLFEQGRRLMASGKLAEACPKLAESQQLDPAGGTLLNLALCHERQGKLATAWTDFKGALSFAHRDGRTDRAQAAEDHIDSLQSKLPWLTVQVVDPSSGEEVSLDGAALGQAAWGTAVAVDPGQHELRAAAPGRLNWTKSVTIAVAQKLEVRLPPLAPSEPIQSPARAEERAARASGRSASSVPDKSSGNPTTAGWLLSGVGVAALGVGGYFGIQTFSKHKSSDRECPTPTTCTSDGVRLNNQAHTTAWIANIGVGVGLVSVGVGTYLLLTTPKDATDVRAQTGHLTIDADVSATGGQMRVRGSF